MTQRCIALLSLFVLAVAGGFAQGAGAAKFEVVSIKRYPPGFIPRSTGAVVHGPLLPGGKYIDHQALLLRLMAFAYPDTAAPGSTLLGLPMWAGGFHGAFFDFEAQATPGTSPSRDEMRRMMQGVLRDRFRLAYHLENRQLEVRYLVVGKGGPHDLQPAAAPRGEYTPVRVAIFNPDVLLTGKAVTMADLAAACGSFFGEPMLDRTALSGYYDLNIRPTRAGAADDPGLRQAILIRALRADFGLDVTSGRATIPVMVIDHVELPSGN